MKPNVVIDEGRFKITMPVKTGTILLHPDWPLGMAVRDIQAGGILEYSSHKNTKMILKWEANEPRRTDSARICYHPRK